MTISIDYYREALAKLDDLIKFCEALPQTKKNAASVRYLTSARANIKFVIEALGGTT